MLHSACVTCRLGLHVSGKFAADTVVIGANVMKTPSSELLGTMELQTVIHYSLHMHLLFCMRAF